MPDGIVAWDHAETVKRLLARRGRDDHGMVGLLFLDRRSRHLAGCRLRRAWRPKPMGPAGRRPALGGFSLAVAAQARRGGTGRKPGSSSSGRPRRPMPVEYLERGGVPARASAYADPALAEGPTPSSPRWSKAGRKACRNSARALPNGLKISEVVQEWRHKDDAGRSHRRRRRDRDRHPDGGRSSRRLATTAATSPSRSKAHGCDDGSGAALAPPRFTLGRGETRTCAAELRERRSSLSSGHRSSRWR